MEHRPARHAPDVLAVFVAHKGKRSGLALVVKRDRPMLLQVPALLLVVLVHTLVAALAWLSLLNGRLS